MARYLARVVSDVSGVIEFVSKGTTRTLTGPVRRAPSAASADAGKRDTRALPDPVPHSTTSNEYRVPSFILSGGTKIWNVDDRSASVELFETVRFAKYWSWA